jgi:hypothetical protein
MMLGDAFADAQSVRDLVCASAVGEHLQRLNFATIQFSHFVFLVSSCPSRLTASDNCGSRLASFETISSRVAKAHEPRVNAGSFTMTIIITAFERSPDGGQGLARDTRVRWALEEVGQPYEVRLVSERRQERKQECSSPNWPDYSPS